MMTKAMQFSSFFNKTHVKYCMKWYIYDHCFDLVVKASASRAEDPGFNSRLRCGDFCGSSHTSDLKIGTPVATLPVLTYAHRSRWSIGHQRHPLRHRGCSGHSGPVGPLLFQLCFSVSPPTVARPASLSLPLRVPGQGLACGAGCWLPEGVSDPAPLPPQYLLGHWFLSLSLPQIFISDLLLPLDFVHAP